MPSLSLAGRPRAAFIAIAPGRWRASWSAGAGCQGSGCPAGRRAGGGAGVHRNTVLAALGELEAHGFHV
ncbi:MAG: hypothetical protein IPI49_23310 [Myxococcales bacterium]|nr:hypothetical protein [Myxococcales bacterium]